MARGSFLSVPELMEWGLRQIDPVLIRAARSLGARPAQLFLRVILRAAVPEILVGLRLGIALSFFVIVISEFIGAEHGLGYLINDGRNFFLVPQMLGAAVLLGLLGYAGNAIRALNIYSMEMNDKIYKGMGEFVEADSVFYTRLLEEVDPALTKWKAKTEVK